jgi:hypothetical protein
MSTSKMITAALFQIKSFGKTALTCFLPKNSTNNTTCCKIFKRCCCNAEGKKITISLRGYTSPRAQSDYNDRLADRRIASVRNEFAQWQNQALKPYIQSGQLKIIALPYGESKANAAVSDDLADRRNSIYTPAAARERRVEIEEVSEQ